MAMRRPPLTTACRSWPASTSTTLTWATARRPTRCPMTARVAADATPTTTRWSRGRRDLAAATDRRPSSASHGRPPTSCTSGSREVPAGEARAGVQG
jgi:hypothetical protein